MKIRKAKISDIDYIYEIETDSFEISWSRKLLEFEIVNSSSNFLLFLEDEIIGFIIYSELFEEVEILNFAILKKFRNMGYGTRILEYVLCEMEGKNINLEVYEKNDAAINLYKKFGFKNLQKRLDYYKKDMHAIVMRRENDKLGDRDILR